MSWNVPKLDLNSARWMPKLVSIDTQSYPALTSRSLRATIGPLQDNWALFHYVIGISGILPYNRNVILQTLELFSAYARLFNAATSPASCLHSAGSLAIIQLNILKSIGNSLAVDVLWRNTLQGTTTFLTPKRYDKPSSFLYGVPPMFGWSL